MKKISFWPSGWGLFNYIIGMDTNNLLTDDMHVFLDLEATLIEGVDQWKVYNSNKKFRNDLLKYTSQNAKVHIFSFALWDTKDDHAFAEMIIPQLEKEYEIKITDCIFKQDILHAVKQIKKIQVLDEFDLSQLVGKRDAFLCFCECFKLKHSTLFDDTVEDGIYFTKAIDDLLPNILNTPIDYLVEIGSINFKHVDFQ